MEFPNDQQQRQEQQQHEQQPQQSGLTFGEKLKIFFCCASYEEDEFEDPGKPSMQISGPTDFRRGDIDISGLTPEQLAMYREKQARDAQRVWQHLRPLHSSPSGAFAERPTDAIPSYEQFTSPRPAPTPGSSPTSPTSPHRFSYFSNNNNNNNSGGGGISTFPEPCTSPGERAERQVDRRQTVNFSSRVRDHARTFSDSFRKSASFVEQTPGPEGAAGRYQGMVVRGADSAVEMRALVRDDALKAGVVVRARSVRDGVELSEGEEEEEERDSERDSREERERFDSAVGKMMDYRV